MPTPDPDESFDDPFAPLEPSAPWRARLDELIDATGLRPSGAVAAAGVVILLAAVGWWSTRPAPPPVDAELPLVVVPSSTTTAPSEVTVHVAGAVRRPGVYTLPPGARMVDAVDAAGGPEPDADLDRLNLAAPARDGDRIHVPALGEPTVDVVGSDASGGAAGRVDINTASASELETLPGVGPATAAAIVDHRTRHGPFTTVEALLEVRGIGEAKLAGLRDLVRV